MPYRHLRVLVLMLSALTLTMEAAHVLELPQKMNYDAALYSAVNTTMYRYFAVVGGPLTVLTLICATGLAVLVRGHPEFRWTLAGAIAFWLAFIVWLTVVAPVNSEIADAATRAPEALPQMWMALRARWEYGHAAGFVLQLSGLACFVWSVLLPREEGARDVSLS